MEHNPLLCTACWLKLFFYGFLFVFSIVVSIWFPTLFIKGISKSKMKVVYDGDNTRVIYEGDES